MKLPHFHLRDLLWLVLLAATITAAWMAHSAGAKRLDEKKRHSFFVRVPRETSPSEAELLNRDVRQKLAKLSDDTSNRDWQKSTNARKSTSAIATMSTTIV